MKQFEAWMKDIGGLRDGILVATGALYILGYAVWQFNAYQHHLGFLPALQAQYFIAGLVPAALIGLVSFLRTLADVAANRAGDVHTPAPWWQMITGLITLLGLGYQFRGYIFRRWYNVSGPWSTAQSVFLILFFLLLTFVWSVESRMQRQMTNIRVLDVFFPAVLGTWGLGLYILVLYPNLPAALGGPHPRCAYFDIVTTKASQDTLHALVSPRTRTLVNDQVARSVPLDVFFSGSDSLLVRPQALVGSGSAELYEVRKDTIQTIVWCD